MNLRLSSRLSPLLRQDYGAIAAEFALVAPLVLSFLFGTIEFGRYMWMRNGLQTGAEAAARCSALNKASCTTVAATQTYAVAKSMGVSVPAATFSVATESCGRVVTASYVFTSITPLIPLSSTITARACRALPT